MQIVQVVVALVVLAAAVRWMPASGAHDPLGRGDARAPWVLARKVPDDADRAAAWMRGATNAASARSHGYWLELVREIEARTPPDATVQVKGVIRNQLWILRYDLYPRRVAGLGYEAGGRQDDPTLPGVAAVLVAPVRTGDGDPRPRVEWVSP